MNQNNNQELNPSIPLDIDLYREIEAIAKQNNRTPHEMANELIAAQIDKAKREKLFYPGIRLAIQKDVMMAAVLESDVDRLKEGLQENENITLFRVQSRTTRHASS